MELDALATGCFVLGIEKSLSILQSRKTGGIFISENGAVLLTENLKSHFQICASAAA